MPSVLYKYVYAVIITGLINAFSLCAQNGPEAVISGKLSVDLSWEPIIYLSYIPTFEDMYSMSNEMILSEAEIDSLGNFKFKLDFLPKEENLYRLHIVKKHDTPATLIIGGKDENHLFLVANCYANIYLTNSSSYPPFRNVTFNKSPANTTFQQISQMVFIKDSIAAESTAAKRLLVLNKLQDDLLTIADTSSNLMVSLFAIYKGNFESNYSVKNEFYKAYVKRWKRKDNAYFASFIKQLPNKSNKSNRIIIGVASIVVLTTTGFLIGKYGFKNKKIEKLSVQERKIYELLQQGASNQEISNHFSIGLSTVKTHVSNIFSKLNVKSRKDIINLK